MSLNTGFASDPTNWQDGIFYEKQKEFLVSMFNNSTMGEDHMNISAFNIFNDTNLSMGASMGNVTDKLFDWEPWRDTLAQVNKWMMGVVLFIIMFSMGCKLYWRKVLQDMRHPVGILIGMLCQFVLLPAVAFSLTKAMSLPKYESLGVLIMSCAPGGGISNFVAYNIDGDLSLSVSMTTISSIMAMVVMPANLWIYSHFLVDTGEDLVIPYMNLFLTLVGIIVPIALGMLIRAWGPKSAEIISKVLTIVTYFALVAAITIIIVLYYPVYAKTSIYMVSSAILLPLLGVITSYIVAMILRQSHQRARTICVETGCQNVPCVISIILFSFTNKKAIAAMIVFPNLYGFISVVSLFSTMIIYKLWKKYCSKQEEEEIGDTIEHDALLRGIKEPVMSSRTKPMAVKIV